MALVPTVRYADDEASNFASFTTPTFAYTPGELLLAAFAYTVVGTPQGGPSISGLLGEWDMVAQVATVPRGVTGDESRRIALWAGRDGSAPVSGDVTFVPDDGGQNARRGQFVIVEWVGAHLDWLVQVLTGATPANSSSQLISLANFQAPSNQAVGFFVTDDAENGVPLQPGSGFASLYEDRVEEQRFLVEHQAGDRTVDASVAANYRWAGIALEMRDDAAVTVINPTVALPGAGVFTPVNEEVVGITNPDADMPGTGEFSASPAVNVITPVAAGTADMPGAGGLTADAVVNTITVLNPVIDLPGSGEFTTDVSPIRIPSGTIRFAGSGTLTVDADGPPPTVARGNEPFSGILGCGAWRAFIQTRGGKSMLAELPWSSVSLQRTLNGFARADVTVNAAGGRAWEQCVAAFQELRTWEHELALYCDGTLAFVGPIVEPRFPLGNVGTVGIGAMDGFILLERRTILQNIAGERDLSDYFQAFFYAAMDLDNSFGLTLITNPTGIKDERNFEAEDRLRVGDEMRRLAQSGLDFTVVGRTVLAGPPDSIAPGTLLIVWDQSVDSGVLLERGSAQATHVFVTGQPPGSFAQTISAEASEPSHPAGVLHQVYNQPRIQDLPGAVSAANVRLNAVLEPPRVIEVRLAERAPFTFDELVPGARADVRLSFTGRLVRQELRLTEVRASVQANPDGVSQTVDIVLGPLAGDPDAG